MTTIEVFADVWCPFAHVGLRAARRERDRAGRDEVAFLIRPWPLELVNGVALDPAVTARHVRELREQVAPDLFSDFREDSFPSTTLPALALVVAAYDQGVATGEAMSWALRDALFESGRDISDHHVLDDIARRVGVERDDRAHLDTVRTEWRRGQDLGVKGSPHFFCATRDAFCPALDIARDERGVLSVLANAERLASFLVACLDPGDTDLSRTH